MKRLLPLVISILFLSQPGLTRPCLSSCANATESTAVPIHTELTLTDKNSCRDDESGADNPALACSAPCSSDQPTAAEPMSFLFSFLVNPFFTISFLAPEECTPSRQNS